MNRFKVMYGLIIVALMVVGHVSAASAGVLAIGVDQTTGANWRTAAALEADNQYGTDGYVVYGINQTDGSYLAPYDHSFDQISLPGYITSVVPPASNMWSGNGNFGTMEDPGNGNAITNTPLLAALADGHTFTIDRVDGAAFRLTLLLASGDGADVTYSSSVDDGGGPVAVTPMQHEGDGLNYHVYDISAGNSDVTVALGANNNFSATGFAFDPLGASLPTMGLEVNTTTGEVTLLHGSGADLDLKGYSIESIEGSLNPAGWNSLAGNPAFGNGNPDDGIGWEQLGAGLATRVGEYNLLDSSIFGPGGTASVGLGDLFTPGETEDLDFQFTTSDGRIWDGMVQYVTSPVPLGDVNLDGVVNGLDVDPFVGVLLSGSFQREADMNSDGVVNGLDVDPFVAAVVGGGVQAVPEPSTLALLTLAGLAIGGVLSVGRRGRGWRVAALMARRWLLIGCAILVFSSAAHAADLWNVDFQGDDVDFSGNPTTLFGQGGVPLDYGPDDSGVWNQFVVAGFSANPQVDYSTDPSMTLVDNDGAASSVTVSLTGDYAGWNGNAGIANALQSDYIILLGNGAVGFPSPPLKMTVSGLTPNTDYNVRLFSGFNTARDMNILVDTNGNGSLTDETAVYGAAGGAATTIAFSSSGSGDMIAEVDLASANESNPSGMQISLYDFEPILTIDRATGQMTLFNGTGESFELIGYKIASNTAGALDPSQWTSIAKNYDADSGNPSVDPDDTWTELTDPSSRSDLSEAELGGSGPHDGAEISHGQTIALGNGWIQNPTEDVSMELLFLDGTILDAMVQYAGDPLKLGDLDFDGDIDVTDWNIFKPGFLVDTTNLSPAESYGAGDLTGDGVIDLADANAFAAAYDAENGAGAFAAVLAVPEPSSILLVGVALVGMLGFTRRHRKE